MAGLKVQEPGPKYCHFNRHPDAGYDLNYFNGLSPRSWCSPAPGGRPLGVGEAARPQPQRGLDCRDYANAGLKIINPDMDAVERRLRGLEEQPKPAPQRRARTKRSSSSAFDDW